MALSQCDIKINSQGRELLDHGNTMFPAACYLDDLRQQPVPWHWHDELEAVVVAEGQAVVAAGTEKHTLRQGDGIFINAGVLHGAWNAGGSDCYFHSVVFHPRLVGGSIDSIYWQNYMQPLLDDNFLKSFHMTCGTDGWEMEALNAVEGAWQACAAEEAGYEFKVREELSRFVFLMTGHRRMAEKKPSEKALRDGERIKIMLQYIQEHYAEDLSTVMIAKSAMISESECLRCFHSTIGTTPKQYLKQFRIQKAAQLLLKTDEKIVMIGTRCGFQEMSYFAKTFRELCGCTPSEYRKKNIEL